MREHCGDETCEEIPKLTLAKDVWIGLPKKIKEDQDHGETSHLQIKGKTSLPVKTLLSGEIHSNVSLASFKTFMEAGKRIGKVTESSFRNKNSAIPFCAMKTFDTDRQTVLVVSTSRERFKLIITSDDRLTNQASVPSQVFRTNGLRPSVSSGRPTSTRPPLPPHPVTT